MFHGTILFEVNYMPDIYDQIEGKVIDTYDKDGCPTNPNFFKRKIQNMARAASTRKKKYIVMGTHGNVIKCINREFHLQQTGGVHDVSEIVLKTCHSRNNFAYNNFEISGTWRKTLLQKSE